MLRSSYQIAVLSGPARKRPEERSWLAMSDDRVGSRVGARPAPREQQVAPGGPQPKAASGLAPGRVTARGVTTRACPPRSESGTGPGSGVRHTMPRRRPGAGASAAADGGPDSTAEPERQAEEPEFTPVSIDSLRQVLDGLKQLS
jgi:hypothetical protein